MGLSDLVTLSMPEEVALVHYWGTQGSPTFLSLRNPQSRQRGNEENKN
jgi:hypothetical protein